MPALTSALFNKGLRFLSARDRDLARVLRKLGPPPMWSREPGFPTLIWIVLEQQVSLASAKAAYDRLVVSASPLTPATFLRLDDRTLKRIGFSRQKTEYGRLLARSIVEGRFDLAALSSMDDATVRAELMKLKGIGAWTADIYLLMALRRSDIWPRGDLALVKALRQVKRLARFPTPEKFDAVGAPWRPWRAVAARILWHHYLSDNAGRHVRKPAGTGRSLLPRHPRPS